MVYVTDWEGDGDQDLVVGDIEGKIHVVRNGSGDKTFKVEKVDRISAARTPISAPGRNSGPVVTDWDGDGKRDLLVGCGNGSVQFFRNTAETGEPVLAAAETLIGASNSRSPTDGKTANPCGSRAKLAVADWNGDGKQDLLVGDVVWKVGKAPKMTEEQKKRHAELQKQLKAYQAKMSESSSLFEDWYGKAFAEHGLETGGDWRKAYGKLDAETRKKVATSMRKFQEADPRWPEYQALSKDYRKVWDEIRPFQAPHTTHGFVWLFLRK